MIRIKDAIVEDCNIVFDVSHGSNVDIHVEGGTFQNFGKFFNERDPMALYNHLGLPTDTPPALVHELLQQLIQRSGSSEPVEETVKSSRLWGYVEKTANSSSILQNLIELGGKGVDFLTHLPF
ncbi:hypothetical protein D3C76_644840 [compost metagenome]